MNWGFDNYFLWPNQINEKHTTASANNVCKVGSEIAACTELPHNQLHITTFLSLEQSTPALLRLDTFKKEVEVFPKHVALIKIPA